MRTTKELVIAVVSGHITRDRAIVHMADPGRKPEEIREAVEKIVAAGIIDDLLNLVTQASSVEPGSESEGNIFDACETFADIFFDEEGQSAVNERIEKIKNNEQTG